ncbi:MAG: DegT/DnrJ/EryC1/StrS family aminotransferase [Actinobacteria bacterium]|nr:DegT/DnrJ/EryC1/StrS family aminotransferase [Actinomycetota bacterium]MBW3646754.1 DegT/DnrJ/EryC1/StrS family aminotransferase [Actinomycetota bacterium]
MTPAVPFLDLSAAHEPITEEIVLAWRQILTTSSFIGGSYVEGFEQEWAAYCQVSSAVGVANGTDALVLALRGLGVGPGDEVVLPANTFVATAEAVVLAGAVPRFVDVDPHTLLLTKTQVEGAVTDRTAAVIAVHLFGQMCDMDALAEVCRRSGLALIEDAAQAHGATWRGRRAGSAGDVGCFSFYPGKNLGALGDGGAVVTDDAALAERIRSLADHGRRIGAKYVHDVVGTNSRLDNMQAAALQIKLPHLDGWNAARRTAMRWYAEELQGLDADLVGIAPQAESVHHLAAVLVPQRVEVAAVLAGEGVASGVHYPIPCHRQVAYARYATHDLPVCEDAAARLLSLPLFPTITREQVGRVGEALRAALPAEVRRAS